MVAAQRRRPFLRGRGGGRVPVRGGTTGGAGPASADPFPLSTGVEWNPSDAAAGGASGSTVSRTAGRRGGARVGAGAESTTTVPLRSPVAAAAGVIRRAPTDAVED